MPTKSLFVLGTGFIGGSVLAALLAERRDEYTISALCRDPSKAEQLKKLGVRPVQGELANDDIISKEAAEADVIMHIATADDLPSVKSILKGLAQRPASKSPAIYIHTSAGVLTVPTRPVDVVFTDKDPQALDKEVPDEAPHREIDLTIKKAVEEKAVNAKISIILPPCIYGIGTGPFNKISIQCPGWIKESIREKKVISHGPDRTWNNIHIKNLATGYLTLLGHLEQSSSQPPLYVFAETGVHRWGDIGDILDRELKKRQLISDDLIVDPEGSEDTETGTQSRATAEWLREWGWKIQDLPSLAESIPEEIDYMIQTGGI